jgi:hypothetical protein
MKVAIGIQRELEIIESLSERQTATTDELIISLELSGYQNPYAALSKPLKNLRNGGILPKQSKKVKQERGAPHQRYRLNRTLATIRKIDEYYPQWQTVIKHIDWFYDVIVKDKLMVKDENAVAEIKKMLRLSPSFFKICLRRQTVVEFARKYIAHEERKRPELNQWAYLINDIKEPTQMDLNSYKRFYMFCYFLDKLNYAVTKESTELLLKYESELKD